MEKVTLSRFSLRSFIAIALLVVAVYVVFTQIQPAEMIKAVRDANLAMALVCVALGFVAWLGSAITLGVFMDSDNATRSACIALRWRPVSLRCPCRPASVQHSSTCSSFVKAAIAVRLRPRL
mgnify:CR=1 FL=1